MITAIPLKHLVRINERVLSDSTDLGREIRYVDIGSVGRGRLVKEPRRMRFSDAPSRARRLVQPGDTIVSTVRTYLRAVWPVSGEVNDLVVSTGFAVLTPTKVDPRYFSWWVLSDSFIDEVVARSVGISYPAIKASELGDLPIRVPTLVEQRAVADYLDIETSRIDALISKKRRMVALLDERKRLLGEEVIAKLQMSDKCAPLKYLVCESDERYGAGPEPTRLAVSIHHGVVPRDSISDKGVVPNDHSRYKVCQPGDIAINRMRAFQGGVGTIRQHGVVSPDYTVLRVSNRVSADYLHFVMRSSWFVSEMTKRLRGIGGTNQGHVRTPRINYADLGLIQIPVPTRTRQDQISSTLFEQETRLARLELLLAKQLETIAERRQALITAAVTGELVVPGVAA